jgi:hypothetical protein
MTRWLIGAAVIAAASTFGVPASAQYAPWCAQYQNRSQVRSCSFYSFAQCQATVTGIGGFCLQNPASSYGAAPPGRYYRGR